MALLYRYSQFHLVNFIPNSHLPLLFSGDARALLYLAFFSLLAALASSCLNFVILVVCAGLLCLLVDVRGEELSSDLRLDWT